MFEFHRLGWINGIGEETSGWWAYITTKEQLDVYLNYNAECLAGAWFDIKEPGHCVTKRGEALSTLLDIKMLKEGKKSLPMIECISTMERVTTSTIIDIFHEKGEAYVNLNGGCRDCSLMTTMDEQILETCKNKDLVFPVYSTKDVSIKRWPEGNHFYITVDGKTVDIDYEGKYNTIEAAESAKKEFLKNNRFKKYRK